jgi:hypothetical protein
VSDEPANRYAFDEPPARPAMKPWKKWLLRTGAGVVGTLLVYLVWDYRKNWLATSELEETRQQLDELEPGWRFDEIQEARAKRLPPDDQNIAKLAMRIKDDTPKEFEEFLTRFDQPEPWLPAPEWNRLPDVEKLAEARRTRTLCQDAIERARMLRRFPSGGVIPARPDNPLNMLLDHVQRLRHSAALLSLNTAVLAADKDGNGAIASARAGLHLVNGVGDEPTLISMLVRIAVAAIAMQGAERTLAYTEPSAGLVELQAELLHEADEPLMAIGIRGERGIFDLTFDFIRTNPNGLQGMAGGGPANPLDRIGQMVARTRMIEGQIIMLRIMTQCLEIAKGPSHHWIAKMEEVISSGFDNPFVKLLFPAINKVAAAALRGQARLRSLAVGIACERFRQANGRWPKELVEIPKSILETIPRDPYVDAPLNYRVLPDGVVVYAVGEDRTDDGGRLTYANPKPGEDVGARLWSPEFRRAK